jgi:hypothetical protein
MENKWKLMLDGLTIFGGAFAWAYQWWNVRFRTQLKADFEILKSLEGVGKEQDNYRIVKAHIDETIAKAYACGRAKKSNQSKMSNHVNRIDLTFSLVFLSSSALWIWELILLGPNWWRALIALGFAFSGIVALFNVLHKRTVSRKVDAIVACQSPG